MSSDSDSDESDPGVQVRVSLKLAASVQDRSLEVPTEPIAVPADIGRKGLSAVLNHLLGRSVTKDKKTDDNSGDSDSDQEDDGKLPPIPFEFIVAGTNNRLLRKGVEKEARQYGISLEEALSITYFPATTAPDLSDEQEQLPDWLSCMTSNPSVLCSGCYDGTIQVYAQSGESLSKLHSAAVATGPIKAMGTTQRENQALWIASASMDQSLSLHTYSAENGLEAFGQCVQEDTSSAISSLDFNKSANSSNLLLASGDGNGCIRLWDINAAGGDGDSGASSATKKKQKTASGKKVMQKDIKSMVTMESAHSQLISGVSWGNHSTDNITHLISGSWDHSIKLWDVEKQDCLLTLNGSRVVSCLDTSYHTEGVVATGHPDCTIRLWDVRVQTTNQSAVVSDTTFRPSHKAWVSQVKWSPSNPYQLASTSHDGTVKLWDIRSSNPLYTVRAFPKEEKGMSLVWAPSTDKDSTKQHLFAGGTDRIIKHMNL
jgi:ribosome biogenesis protein YTM1